MLHALCTQNVDHNRQGWTDQGTSEYSVTSLSYITIEMSQSTPKAYAFVILLILGEGYGAPSCLVNETGKPEVGRAWLWAI